MKWLSKFRSADRLRSDKYVSIVLAELDRARRFNRPLSVIAFSVDGFPNEFPAPVVSVDLGSQTMAAQVQPYFRQDLAQKTRAHDVVLRVSEPGPAILFICPETDIFAAHTAAKRLAQIVKRNIENEITSDRINYGVAFFPADGATMPALIHYAIDNMDSAKPRLDTHLETLVHRTTTPGTKTNKNLSSKSVNDENRTMNWSSGH